MMKKYLLLDPRFIAYRPVMELSPDAELGKSVFTHAVHLLKVVAKRVTPRLCPKRFHQRAFRVGRSLIA